MKEVFQEPRGCPTPRGTPRPAPPEHPPAGGCQPRGGGTASPGTRPPRGAAAGWRGARPRPFPAAQQPGSHSWDSCELRCWRRERSPLCGRAAAGTTAWAGHRARPPAPGSGPGTAKEQLHAAPSPGEWETHRRGAKAVETRGNGMVFVGARRGLAGGKSFIGHPLRTQPVPAAEAAVTTHRAAPMRRALAAAQPSLTLGYSQTGRGTGAKPEGSEAKEHGRDEPSQDRGHGSWECRQSSDLIPKTPTPPRTALRLLCPCQEVEVGPGGGRTAAPSLGRGPGAR